MKTNNPLNESTEKLLRAPLPDAPPRPGFETRLMACLAGAQPHACPAFGKFAVAAAALVLLLLVLFRSGSDPAPSAPVAESRPVLQVEDLPNPLAREADAMRSTAERAGRFLISQFPSLPAEDQL